MTALGEEKRAASGVETPAPSADRRARIGVYWVSETRIERHDVADVPTLLTWDDGFVWIDIPTVDEPARQLLTALFGFHTLAVQDCFEPSPVPKLHAYADHVFLVLHTPEDGRDGRIRHVEFNQFIGRHYLVTVHRPQEAGVAAAASIHETNAVRERLEAGRSHAGSPFELSYAIVTGLARCSEALVWTLARKVGDLEQHVLESRTAKPKHTQMTVEDLFRVRHELLTVQTMAAENRVVYARIAALARFIPPEGKPFIDDLQDQFDRVGAMCEVQSRFLQELLDYYQTRIASDLSEFVKRLTALGTILVSATLIAGIYGMNFSNMPELSWRFGYPLALGMMVAFGGVLAWWFNRKGWL
jgi:magnesium transporter